MLMMHSRSRYGPVVYPDNGMNITGNVTVVLYPVIGISEHLRLFEIVNGKW
jgi:hypothetical protein